MIRPVGIVAAGAVHNAIMDELAVLRIITADAAIGSHPELPLPVFIKMAYPVVRQGIFPITHFIPGHILFFTQGLGETNQSVGSAKPVGSVCIAKHGIELVPLSRPGDL